MPVFCISSSQCKAATEAYKTQKLAEETASWLDLDQGPPMAALVPLILLAACILVLLDRAAGTETMVLSAASFSGVYLLIFYSRRAVAAASSSDRRFSIRAAWCASLILVFILGYEVQQYAFRSNMIYVWAIAGSVQLVVLIVLEVFHPTTTADRLHTSAPV